MLSGEECRAAGGAGLLTIVLEEANAFFADAIDVRRFIAHQSTAIGADVGNPNVVAKDDKDVWFVRRPGSSGLLCLRKATGG